MTFAFRALLTALSLRSGATFAGAPFAGAFDFHKNTPDFPRISKRRATLDRPN